MEFIQTFLNLVAPPFTFFSLLFFLPPFYFFKSFLSVLYPLFRENVAYKVVIITGASSGIGEHLAYEYAKRGACLALVARKEKQLRGVVETARELGSPEVIMIFADVQRVEDCRLIVEKTINHFGRLDHLVNNAGIQSIGLFEDITEVTTFRMTMDTNFWGPAYTTHFAVPHLRKTGGKIIVLSSAAAWLPEPRMSFYNASKAALLTFFETLRIELGSDVNILIVTPGFIDSEMTQGKYLTKDGRMNIDQDLRDVQVSAVPVRTATGCAKSILKSACRGDKYLTEPAWFRVTYLWKVCFPDVIEWVYRLFYLTRPGEPATEPPSKKLVDITGVQRFLYPESIQTPELKTE